MCVEQQQQQQRQRLAHAALILCEWKLVDCAKPFLRPICTHLSSAAKTPTIPPPPFTPIENPDNRLKPHETAKKLILHGTRLVVFNASLA